MGDLLDCKLLKDSKLERSLLNQLLRLLNANMKLDERNPHFLKSKIMILKLQAPVFCLPYDLF